MKHFWSKRDYTCWKHYWFSFKLLIFLKKILTLRTAASWQRTQWRWEKRRRPKQTPESTNCVLWTLSCLHKAFKVSDLNTPSKRLVRSKLPVSLDSLAFYKTRQCHWVLVVKEISNYKVFFLPKNHMLPPSLCSVMKQVILILCSRWNNVYSTKRENT